MLLISTPFSMYLIYLRALFVPFLRAIRSFYTVKILLRKDSSLLTPNYSLKAVPSQSPRGQRPSW